jgi:serine/threonine protein kinase
MPRCELCHGEHAPGAPCAGRSGTTHARRRRTPGALAAPPPPETVIGGRYRLVRLARELPGMALYAAEAVGEDGSAAAPAWVRIYGRPASPAAADDFLVTAGALRGLPVAGAARIVDCGCDGARGLYVVEDLGDRRELPELAFRGDERIPVVEAATLMWKVTDAIAALHRAGLVHGALRPDCIVVGADGEPRLGDLLGRAAHRATLAVPAASPYDAPERAPRLTATAAEDVFGCAAILFHLLAGRAPGPEAAQVPLSELFPDVPMPSVLEDALRRALSARPHARPAVAELAAAIARAVKELTGPAGDEARATELGRYALVRRLARGGMGEVFLARIAGGTGGSPPRICVVKRIRGEFAADEERVARFVAEARLAARMKHPNVVAVYDLGRAGEDLFIVMEYVAGKNLREVVARLAERGEPMPVRVAVYLAHQLVSGLGYVHGFIVPGLAPEGLVHRDVSPQNVLLGYDGAVKLIDFGLARGGLGNPKTAAGIVVGKLAYLSPEQARAQVATPQSDLYAAGLTLWELLCGRPHFAGEQPEEVIAAVRDPRPLPPSTVRRDLPPVIDRICLRAMQPDRAARYPDAAAFARDLGQLLGGDPRAAGAEAGAFLSRLFAEERRAEERMARAALELVGTQPRAPAVEARGRSLVHDSDAFVSSDTSRTSAPRPFDWDALADSLPGPGEELPGSDTTVTQMPLEPTPVSPAPLAPMPPGPVPPAPMPLHLDRTAPITRVAPVDPTQQQPLAPADRTQQQVGRPWIWVGLAVAVGTLVLGLLAFWLLRSGAPRG